MCQHAGITDIKAHLKKEFEYLTRLQYEDPTEFAEVVEEMGGIDNLKNTCLFLKQELLDKE